MSSLSAVSSVSNPYQNPYITNFQEKTQNFQAIGSALQSGDLAGAQSALTTFQQALASSNSNAQSSSTQPFGKNSQANTDYQNLVSALQSGNLSNAQQAFTSIQSDLKTAHVKGHHHHHGSAVATSSTSNTTGIPGMTAPVTGATNSLTAMATGGAGSLLNVSA